MKREKRAKDSLRQLRVRPSRERGQNFLIDPAVISTIVDFGNPLAGQALVEIGPGLGALTEQLHRIGPLTVIEIEDRFCQDLRVRFPDITVVSQDVRSVAFSGLGKDLVIFGNLPYSFSTDIVFHLVEQAASIRRAVLMLQREFAERMAAMPGGRQYGVLSISCQMWADIRLGPVIPGTAFHPPASVESRLLEMTFLPQARFAVSDQLWFKKIVRGAFLQRRKKIVNSLLAAGILSRSQIEAGLRAARIDPGVRAETVSIEQFVQLADACR